MEKDVSLAIVAAADRAIKFQNQSPGTTIEEAIGHAMNTGNSDEGNIVAVAAASEVFRFKEKHKRAKDKEVLRYIISKIPEIVRNVNLEV